MILKTYCILCFEVLWFLDLFLPCVLSWPPDLCLKCFVGPQVWPKRPSYFSLPWVFVWPFNVLHLYMFPFVTGEYSSQGHMQKCMIITSLPSVWRRKSCNLFHRSQHAEIGPPTFRIRGCVQITLSQLNGAIYWTYIMSKSTICQTFKKNVT